MARLPVPGGDDGQWGQVLNDYLSVAHDATGALKDASLIASISSKYVKPASGIPETDLATAIQTKLNAPAGVIADDSITSQQLAPSSVTSSELADNAATAAKIATGAVTTAKIPDGAITAPKIASGVSLTDLDGTKVTAEVDLNNHRLTGVATPTAGTDAANKTYVDTLSTSSDTIVNITHGGGVLNLDHSLGNYFNVTLNGDVTALTESSVPTIGSFWLKLSAVGATRNIDLTSATLDDSLTTTTSILDGETLIAQGVIYP